MPFQLRQKKTFFKLDLTQLSKTIFSRLIKYFRQVHFPDAIKVKADGTQVQLDEVEKIPGEDYEFQIKAPQGTRLGLLSVDQSVYHLRNANRLTKERVSIIGSVMIVIPIAFIQSRRFRL